MNIFFFILMGIELLGLGMMIAEHGKPKTGNHNFFISLIAFLITWGLILAGLYL